MARFVHAVHVAERRGQQISGACRIHSSRDFQRVLRCRVEFRGGARRDPILFAANDAGLDLEDEVAFFESFEQLHCDVEVLFQRQRAAIEHVAGEQIRLAGRPSPLRFLHEWDDERVHLVCLAVIGVERDVNRVPVGDTVDVLRDRQGTEGHVLQAGSRYEGAAASRHLNDAVTSTVGESFQNGVRRARRCHVDGGVGESSPPRPIEHLAVGRVVGYRHGVSFSRFTWPP